MDKGEDKRLTAAFDVYVSDFGTHRIVPNRFSREDTCFVLTPGMWAIDWLRSYRTYDLARTGDAERKMIICQYTLRSSNEAASGCIADVA